MADPYRRPIQYLVRPRPPIPVVGLAPPPPKARPKAKAKGARRAKPPKAAQAREAGQARRAADEDPQGAGAQGAGPDAAPA